VYLVAILNLLHSKHCSKETGTKPRQDHDDPDFAPFRDIVAENLLKTWPLGPGDEVMGQPVTERQVHSVLSAAEETGIDPRRLRKMLFAAGLIDGTLPDTWAVFNAKDAEHTLAPLVEYLTAKDFAELNGLTRSQFDLLVQDGILLPALDDAETKHVWDPRHGRAFLDSLLVGAQPLQQPLHGWEPISKTAQRLKIRPGEIVRALWDGRIHRVTRNAQSKGYGAIQVYYDEVAQVLGNEAPPAMNLEVFAKVVGLGKVACLTRLIRKGHTSSTEMQNPKTKAFQPYITSADSAAFNAKFVTLGTLAKAKGTTWQKLSSTLRAKGIEPFSPDGANYGNIYLRETVEAALT
jgi:hypothetical protein